MSTTHLSALFGAIALLTAPSAYADPRIEQAVRPGLAGDTLLIIRHAEKPAEKAEGAGLAPAGQARARAYANYFKPFTVDGAPVRLTDLIATADSTNSARPRLTLTPLSQALGLPIQQPFADDQVDALADWLAEGVPHRAILIAWHHHKLPALLAALGADPAALLPGGSWPNDTYDWVVVLNYDDQGKLKDARLIVEPNLSHQAQGSIR